MTKRVKPYVGESHLYSVATDVCLKELRRRLPLKGTVLFETEHPFLVIRTKKEKTYSIFWCKCGPCVRCNKDRPIKYHKMISYPDKAAILTALTQEADMLGRDLFASYRDEILDSIMKYWGKPVGNKRGPYSRK